MSILETVINIICISIPEEFFIAFLSLYLIKVFKVYNHDYFDINNNFFRNILKIMLVSAIPMAILSNILVIFKVNESIVPIIGIIATPITIILLVKIKKTSKIIIASTLVLCAFIASCMNQAIIYSIIFYITNTKINDYTNSEIMKILLTLFPRVIEWTIISIVLIKRNSIIKTDVIRTILKSKLLISISVAYITGNTLLSIIISKYIIVDNILTAININNRLANALIIFIVLTMNMLSIWVVSTFIQMKDRYRYKYGREMEL